MARGLPAILIWPALLFNGIALSAGERTIALPGAACSAVIPCFPFLPDDPGQMSIFVRNRVSAGGFLLLAANVPFEEPRASRPVAPSP